jgi:hypothetical protein
MSIYYHLYPITIDLSINLLVYISIYSSPIHLPNGQLFPNQHTHTHTHTHIYIYMYNPFVDADVKESILIWIIFTHLYLQSTFSKLYMDSTSTHQHSR